MGEGKGSQGERGGSLELKNVSELQQEPEEAESAAPAAPATEVPILGLRWGGRGEGSGPGSLGSRKAGNSLPSPLSPAGAGPPYNSSRLSA